MGGIPTGTVTFLFTDIEGSMDLARFYPDRWEGLRARHDAILRKAIGEAGGFVFQVVGDAFCAAFASARSAAEAALSAQAGLAAEGWDPAPIRVRMGIHSGEASYGSSPSGGDYVGYETLALAQRVMSAGHGGQVLLSGPALELLGDRMPKEAVALDLGRRRLKGFERPQRVYQLSAPGLRSDFPPLATLEARPSNIPASPTSFVGRAREKAEILALLRSTRLLTLLGAGGSGKTRLALEVGRELVDAYDDGVWFVDLAPAPAGSDPALAVLSALALRAGPGASAREILEGCLKTRTALIVMDNCEHLAADCAALAELLVSRCPGVSLLATSREALCVPGEATYLVPLLGTPAPRERDVLRLSAYDSVTLFLDRAKAARAGFAIDDSNAADVAEICARLDGLPLAIELAASRVRSLPVRAIRERLDDRFRLLSAGPRTALPRQQTLEALISWSWDLLDGEEKRCFAGLSVFAGRFGLEDAEAALGADAADLVPRLIEKSLVVFEENDGRPRYRLLESIRSFAARKLAESGDAEAARSAHLAHYLSIAAGIRAGMLRAATRTLLDRAEAILEEAKAAAEFALSTSGRAGDAARLLAAIGEATHSRGRIREFAPCLERAWTARAEIDDIGARAGVALWLAASRAEEGGYREASALYDESIALYEGAGDRLMEFWARFFAANNGFYIPGRDSPGGPLDRELEQVAALGESLGDPLAEATASFARAVRLLYVRDEGEAARAVFAKAAALAESCGDLMTAWASEFQLARIAVCEEEYEEAEARIAKVRSYLSDIGDPQSLASCMTLTVSLEQLRGNREKALEASAEVLELNRRFSAADTISASMQEKAAILASLGQAAAAEKLAREAAALCRAAGDEATTRAAEFRLAFACLASGSPEEATAILDAELGQARRADDSLRLAHALMRRARLHLAREEYAEAERRLAEAAALQEEGQMPGRGPLAATLSALSRAARGERTDEGEARAQVARWVRGLDPVLLSAWLAILAKARDRAGDGEAAALLGATALGSPWLDDFRCADVVAAIRRIASGLGESLGPAERSRVEAEARRSKLFATGRRAGA